MPMMSRDEHEALLSELLTPELEHSRKTEILQLLRKDNGIGHTEYAELTASNEKLQKDNADLVVSNSKLFREVGLHDRPDKVEEVQKQEYSETVTIESLEI